MSGACGGLVNIHRLKEVGTEGFKSAALQMSHSPMFPAEVGGQGMEYLVLGRGGGKKKGAQPAGLWKT